MIREFNENRNGNYNVLAEGSHSKTVQLTLLLKSNRSSIPRHTWMPILTMLIFGLAGELSAQENDSTLIDQVRGNKTIKKLMGLITRDARPNAGEIKSEKNFVTYEGKIIRQINIRRLGFEQSVTDTSQVIKTLVAKVANRVHHDTRSSIIRNHLFIKENQRLNAFRVADNERLIRNLEFILDARILVRPISSNSDSVDLLVITRDVFSLGGSISPQLPSEFKAGIKNINFAGRGQRIEYRQIYNTTRVPRFGYEFINQFTNVRGTFIDMLAGYTQLNHGPGVGNENERSFYIKFTRDLFHPFARFAGAVEFSDNISRNVFPGKEDSTFVQYHYLIQDYWVGYTFGNKKLSEALRENRRRKFIAIRVFEQRFLNNQRISFSEQDIFAYRDKVSILTQLSFFRRDFYKTRYVLGFGRTEDIPYGHRILFTTGIERELGLNRPYVGSEVYYDQIRENGTIVTYSMKSGSFFRHGIEDGLIQFAFSRYSRIHQNRRVVLRHRVNASYTILLNQNLKRGVTIRDRDGIPGFRPDSLIGSQRIIISEETVAYLPWKVLGFRIAPVGRIDIAIIKLGAGLRTGSFFSGMSLGLRARNENLIFNTIEARLFYYPTIVEGLSHFNFNITSNFRIRYPTSLVSKPATVFP